MNKDVAGLFKTNPKVDKLYITEDNQGFRDENSARNQAAALRKAKRGTGKVTPVTRAEVDKWVPELSEGEGAEVAEVEHVITQEDLDNNPDLGVQGVKVGDNVQIPLDADPKMSKEEAAVALAEKDLAAAQAAGSADAIATAKKALSTAKAAYTRSLKK